MQLRNPQPVNASKNSICGLVISVLIALTLCTPVRAAEAIEVFRTGDELIVMLDRFDLLHEANVGLSAELKLRGVGKDEVLLIDLSDAAVKGALVVDLSKFGNCAGVSISVKDAAGNVLTENSVAPIVEIPVPSKISVSPAGPLAYIEPGTAITGAGLASPKIPLPDAKKLRSVQIGSASRSVFKRDITFPVISQGEAPLSGGAFLGRETAAPNDPTRGSLYISYKKAIYEGGDKLARWQKFLAEIPIQESWGEGQGDETVQLAGEVQVHVTNEVKEHWSGVPRSILGEGEDYLRPFGADDEGRIYATADQGGLVRFDPHTRKFESAPAFNLQKLCPGGDTQKGSPGWLCGIRMALCTRGRVFFIEMLDYKTGPNPGSDLPQRRIGGVFSVSQDWSDATAFAADTRLHVGTWETATPTLYKTSPVVGAAADERKLGFPLVTEAGLLIVPAGKKSAGGPWRLDLDDQGNNIAFGEVDSLTDTVSKDGLTKFAPTKEATVNGIPKRLASIVSAHHGRALVEGSGTGGLTIPRASVRQMLMSDGWNNSMLLPSPKNAFLTYAGAPEGVVTVGWDIIENLKTAPEAQGPLVDSLRGGASLGPVFLVTPVPGEPDKAVAICDYGTYALSTFDFSRLEDQRVVRKTPLPARAAVPVGLGVYDSAWVEQDDEQWLYFGGYVGMTRIQYSKGGNVLDSMTSEMFNQRLAQMPVGNQHARGGLKQYDRIFPVFGGRLMDSGASRSGRGGEAFGTGLELFDPNLLGSGTSTDSVPTQTAAYMSRCCGSLGTIQSRMIWNAHDGGRRQEIFGSGRPSQVFVDELGAQDKALAPGNLEEKVFNYEVTEDEGLRDLFGFSLPLTEQGESVGSYLALSPCQRFLMILTEDGTLYTYSIAQKQFIDGVKMKSPGGDDVATIGFRRPGQNILTSPDGQQFILTAPAGKEGAAVQFNRIVVGRDGTLTIEPYLRIDGADNDDWQDLRNCVRCFMPDLKHKDGSIDFVIGWDSKDRAQAKPFVRVIADFIPPSHGK